MDVSNDLTELKEASLQFDVTLFRKARQVLKSMDHPLRQKICRLIHQNKRMIVTDIYKTLNLEQSVASIHLEWLRNARVVSTERQGKLIYYSLNYKRFSELNEIISHFLTRQSSVLIKQSFIKGRVDFELSVTYKGKKLILQARPQRLGHIRRYQVTIDGSEVLFEPDKENLYRPLIDLNLLQGNRKLDKELLKTIAASLKKHAR